MEPSVVQGDMEQSGGPHSDSGSISPSWERDRRGPMPGPPGPLGPQGVCIFRNERPTRLEVSCRLRQAWWRLPVQLWPARKHKENCIILSSVSSVWSMMSSWGLKRLIKILHTYFPQFKQCKHSHMGFIIAYKTVYIFLHLIQKIYIVLNNSVLNSQNAIFHVVLKVFWLCVYNPLFKHLMSFSWAESWTCHAQMKSMCVMFHLSIPVCQESDPALLWVQPESIKSYTHGNAIAWWQCMCIAFNAFWVLKTTYEVL